jgi:hypothetical protein
MMPLRLSTVRLASAAFAVSAAFALCPALPAAGRDGKPSADGFTPMFNGRDLTGWVNVNCHPSTFFVKDGEIVTTGKPTGFLRTEKQYENFELELDWMHVNKKEIANSGLFVWGDPIPAVGTPYTRGIDRCSSTTRTWGGRRTTATCSASTARGARRTARTRRGTSGACRARTV